VFFLGSKLIVRYYLDELRLQWNNTEYILNTDYLFL
jgi:hypothetical protein